MTDVGAGARTPWSTTGLEVLGPRDFSGGRLQRSGTNVVCFSAEWCPVTRRFMPKFLALRGTLPALLMIADITDLKSPLWDDFHIRITPSIIVYREGEVFLRLDGRRFFGLRDPDMAKLAMALPPH
ncbi:MAG: thioredoxin family protein [Thermoplasmata archaeon]